MRLRGRSTRATADGHPPLPMHALMPLRPQPPSTLPARRVLAPQRQPNTERLVYAQAILGVQARAMALLNEELVPQLPGLVEQAGIIHDAAVRASTYADEVMRALGIASKKLFAEFTNAQLRKTAAGIAARTSTLQKNELARQLASIYRKDITIDVFAEAGIKERLEAFAAANVQLVKDVPTEFYKQVGQQVVQGLRSGKRADELAAEIRNRYGISERRAQRIAVDQVGRLNAELNRARQEDLGIDSFTWADTGDERECEECLPYHGKTFLWTTAPELPGEIHVCCRCYGEPNVQAMIDAL